MPKIILFVAAEKILIDKLTNHVSAINIFTSAVPEGLPLLFTDFGLLCHCFKEEGDEDQLNIEFTITNAGEEIFKNNMRVNFQGSNTNHSVVNIKGLIVKNPGDVTITGKLNGNEVCGYSFQIQAPPPKATNP